MTDYNLRFCVVLNSEETQYGVSSALVCERYSCNVVYYGMVALHGGPLLHHATHVIQACLHVCALCVICLYPSLRDVPATTAFMCVLLLYVHFSTPVAFLPWSPLT